MTRIAYRSVTMLLVALGLAAIPSHGSQGVGALSGPVTLADEAVYHFPAAEEKREQHVLQRAHAVTSEQAVALALR